MVSPLSPQQFAPAQNFGEQLLGAVAQGQGIQQNRQALQMNDQAMQMRGQNQQQQVSEYDYMTGVRRLEVINRLAKHARTLATPQEREQFKQSIDPSVLESVGIDPAQLAQTPVDDRGLDSLIAQTQAALPQQNQQQYRKESVNTNEGLMVFDPVSGSYKPATGPDGKPLKGAQYDADLQAEIAGGKSGASKTAELQARGELEPEVQRKITEARETAKLEAQKVIKQQGQMNKLDDADRLYKNLSEADLGLIYGRGEKWYPEFFRSQKGIDLIAQRDQLVGMLNLAARGQLAGQGAVSDSEAKAILSSATTLAEPNISAEEARQALDAAMRQIYGGAGQEFNQEPQAPTRNAPASSRYQIEVIE